MFRNSARKVILALSMILIAVGILSLVILVQLVELASTLDELQRNNEVLAYKVENLSLRLKKLNSSYTDLLSKYRTLHQEYAKLFQQYQETLEKLTNVSEVLVKLQTKLALAEKLSEDVLMWYKYDVNTIVKSLPTILREATQQTTTIVTIMGLETDNVYTVTRDLFIYSMTSLSYQRDDYVKLLDVTKLEIYTIHNTWSLPNITLLRKGGECEDFAILAYSVLRSVAVAKQTYVLMWYGRETSHVATLYVDRGGVILIDLTGNWVNGYGIYLSMNILRDEGTAVNVYLNPLYLDPKIKKELLSLGLATLIAIDYEENETMSIYQINLMLMSPDKALREWLQYWAKQGVDIASIQGYVLCNELICKNFSSLDSLINYIKEISRQL